MPHHETVGVLLSCVTQPHLALEAVPRGQDRSFAPTVAPGTASSLVLGLLHGITFWDGWKMPERE